MKETQTSKLVNYLLQEKDHWISSALLSDYLSVSTRQIRKYVAALIKT
ncbi:HTH domain-containing protein [Traorella massiliensis]|nr:HTH domain-containing protein [Traorella massiliensis]